MSKKLKEWPNTARASRYDWDKLFDGSMWMLSKGVDYKCAAESFRVQAYAAAKIKGTKLRTARVGDDDLALQALGTKGGE